MARRARGRGANREGSVFRCGTGWRAKAFSGYDPESGAPKYKWFAGKTQEAVLAQKNVFDAAFSMGRVPSTRAASLHQWATEWLESEKGKLAPRTTEYYANNLRLHILPLLGGMRLNEIRPLHVRRVVQTAARNGLGPRGQQAVFATLRALLADALRADMIADNPALRVEGPKQDPHTPRALTEDEARALVSALDGNPARGPLLTNLLLGCRVSETLGIRWEDVDLNEGTVIIRGQLQRIGGELAYIPLTKTREARTLGLPTILVALMKAEEERQSTHHFPNPLGLVFLNRKGRPWDRHNVGDYLHIAQDAAKLPRTGTHVLRHTAATNALAAGIDLHAVAKQLGHKNTRLTADLYGQASLDRSRALASRLEERFMGTPQGCSRAYATER